MADATVQLQAQTIQQMARPITGSWEDYDPIMDLVGNARFVLIGEASHGTHDFYNHRARISRRLIEEKGFNAIAVEADWPDAYRLNRYVRGMGDDETALDALADFKRFPTWMWRNTVMLDFIGWLREHNDRVAGPQKAGLYGLDLYSMYASIEAVLRYLESVDPEAAKRARYRYSCFESFRENPQEYGYVASFDLGQKCEDEAVQQLVDMQRRAAELIRSDGRRAEDEVFFAEQNARVVANAEEYYRSMFRGHIESWNLRDQHMAGTLDALQWHLSRQGSPSKIIVWEHNSHLGDARATEMGQGGELNVGQLVRQKYSDQSRLLGFTTYTGTVTAADDWDEPAKRKRVRRGLPESYEGLFHDLNVKDFFLNLRDGSLTDHELERPRLERAIGVIYRPETERLSHYFFARISDQFDGVIHLDETRALEPLERTPQWETGEPPETFPSGF